MARSKTPAKKPVRHRTPRWVFALGLIPFLGILWVWFSALSFVPVPWPDDSAFYFPAKDLFSWPPRWVMIPQAPFEPSYREWNFNTMPLFPILIGLARWIGIDGSHALKLLPLGAWFFSCAYILYALGKEPRTPVLLVGAMLVLTFDPILRWSSVLVRPESLIGFCGVFILFGYRFGWPRLLRERLYFHPVSLALAIGAYLHFNAIHLVPLVLVLYWNEPKKILKIGGLTALALVPWMITAAFKPALFVQQMELQFTRLTGYRNPWLNTWRDFMSALHSDMGTPEPWSPGIRLAIEICVFFSPFLLIASLALLAKRSVGGARFLHTVGGRSLLGAFVWFICSLYLWHTKAEVWFTHYIHLTFFAWAILAAHEAFEFLRERETGRPTNLAYAIPVFLIAVGAMFFTEQKAQADRLGATQTWKWSTYADWIDCIDQQLRAEETRLGHPKPFRVWAPTFPDILIELSRKHPDWEFTRTNDFFARWDLGVQHGRDVHVMVVPETFRGDEQFYSGPLSERPNAQSVWMNWDQYFLIRLQKDPTFKPRRYLCQRGRWDAFIYLPAID
jgi:hypothetical protein